MEYFQNQINISLLKNYILKDPICDWFNINNELYEKDKPSHYKNLILNESNKYKQDLFEKIVIMSGLNNINLTNKDHNETEILIRDNNPIIINGSLYNPDENINVNCDIIIRFDYFKKLFPSISNVPFHLLYQNPLDYMLIGVSYSSLKFKIDLMDVNNDGVIPYKKCSLYSFQSAFYKIMGYKPHCFILGKGYQYKNAILPSNDFICYFQISDCLIQKYNKALQWIIYIKNNYSNMNIRPTPTHNELYPNMNYKESDWEIEKHKLAIQIKEITLVWNITYDERCNYVERGITCWDDNRLINNLKESKKKDIQERMIHMNKNNDILIYPRKTVSDSFKNILEMDGIYFDVESFLTFDQKQDLFNGEVFPVEPIIAILGFIYNDHYYDFTIQDYNIQDEENIIKLFSDKLHYISNGDILNIYHWGHAENGYFNYIYKKYPQIQFPRINLVNVLDHFRTEPVIVQGVFKFGLKEIGTALYKNGLINTTWGENDNGLDSMIRFKKICLERNKNIPLKRYNEISEIVEYNMIDCRVLFEIVEVLRKIYL
tara:strand:+ start:3740 stop:5374 length:1635 start_codon:yes stop_codon:yes gene_type:complete